MRNDLLVDPVNDHHRRLELKYRADKSKRLKTIALIAVAVVVCIMTTKGLINYGHLGGWAILIGLACSVTSLVVWHALMNEGPLMRSWNSRGLMGLAMLMVLLFTLAVQVTFTTSALGAKSLLEVTTYEHRENQLSALDVEASNTSQLREAAAKLDHYGMVVGELANLEKDGKGLTKLTGPGTVYEALVAVVDRCVQEKSRLDGLAQHRSEVEEQLREQIMRGENVVAGAGPVAKLEARYAGLSNSIDSGLSKLSRSRASDALKESAARIQTYQTHANSKSAAANFLLVDRKVDEITSELLQVAQNLKAEEDTLTVTPYRRLNVPAQVWSYIPSLAWAWGIAIGIDVLLPLALLCMALGARHEISQKFELRRSFDEEYPLLPEYYPAEYPYYGHSGKSPHGANGVDFRDNRNHQNLLPDK